mmetsp:Transcript_2584/g.6603  ORF Transcript_2584/g.6603 Transcript_2584/m.6603 type:complete len:167 (+) Transcript_2584:727-1227(+)
MTTQDGEDKEVNRAVVALAQPALHFLPVLTLIDSPRNCRRHRRCRGCTTAAAVTTTAAGHITKMAMQMRCMAVMQTQAAAIRADRARDRDRRAVPPQQEEAPPPSTTLRYPCLQQACHPAVWRDPAPFRTPPFDTRRANCWQQQVQRGTRVRCITLGIEWWHSDCQ